VRKLGLASLHEESGSGQGAETPRSQDGDWAWGASLGSPRRAPASPRATTWASAPELSYSQTISAGRDDS
jgi:hypothetical protein